jgi:hypothetical protein
LRKREKDNELKECPFLHYILLYLKIRPWPLHRISFHPVLVEEDAWDPQVRRMRMGAEEEEEQVVVVGEELIAKR